MPWGEEHLSRDAFLGGRLQLWQPRHGYRAGIDPVLLAAATPAHPGQSVLELGCGVGTAALCLGVRVNGLRLIGLELQADYAVLARRNGAENGQDLQVTIGDLTAMPEELRRQSFDHVIANPPYYHAAARSAGRDAGRELAHAGDTPLARWVDVALRRLAPGGWLTLIQRAERLPELLAALDHRVGDVSALPLAPRRDRPTRLVLVRARKGARGAFILHQPLVLHDGAAHDRDRDSYSAPVSHILRQGAALPWPVG